MGERKVLNFYISPDFDHSIIPRMKRDREKLNEIRMMLPFSLRCNTCGEYMYAGKKFNSKKELIKGEDYLGIKKFRFYIKCSVCSAEITFKTDPKNSDYECEYGASRNFEIWRDTNEAIEAEKKLRDEEDKMDSMKSLENRTLDNKIEMDVLDALDEIRAINQRHERVDTNAVLSSLTKADEKVQSNGLTKSDEELLKTIKFRSTQSVATNSTESATSDEILEEVDIRSKLLGQLKSNTKFADEPKASSSLPLAIVARKKRKVDEEVVKIEAKVDDFPTQAKSQSPTVTVSQPAAAPVSALNLMSGYGDSDDE